MTPCPRFSRCTLWTVTYMFCSVDLLLPIWPAWLLTKLACMLQAAIVSFPQISHGQGLHGSRTMPPLVMSSKNDQTVLVATWVRNPCDRFPLLYLFNFVVQIKAGYFDQKKSWMKGSGITFMQRLSSILWRTTSTVALYCPVLSPWVMIIWYQVHVPWSLPHLSGSTKLVCPVSLWHTHTHARTHVHARTHTHTHTHTLQASSSIFFGLPAFRNNRGNTQHSGKDSESNTL